MFFVHVLSEHGCILAKFCLHRRKLRFTRFKNLTLDFVLPPLRLTPCTWLTLQHNKAAGRRVTKRLYYASVERVRDVLCLDFPVLNVFFKQVIEILFICLFREDIQLSFLFLQLSFKCFFASNSCGHRKNILCEYARHINVTACGLRLNSRANLLLVTCCQLAFWCGEVRPPSQRVS